MAKSLDKILNVFTETLKELDSFIKSKAEAQQYNLKAIEFHKSEIMEHGNEYSEHQHQINKALRVHSQIRDLVK